MEKSISKGRSVRQIDAAAELLDDIVATYDVLSVTMSYICWELSRNPDYQTRLHDELLTLSSPMILSSTAVSLPPAKELDQLPILHAITMETMRIHATNSGMEPRWTPANVKTTLGGYSGIQGGTRVSSSPYSLHRNVEIYPQPDEWHPERFKLTMEEKGKWAGKGQAEKWFWGFSSGPRMCIGNYLSMHCKLFVYETV